MKAVAISIDEYIFKANGQYYGNNVGYDIVKRYADNFETVHLISRVKQVDRENLEKHDHLLPFKNIVYYEVPFFTSIGELIRQRRQANQVVANAVKDCGCALVRVPSIIGFMVLQKFNTSLPYALEVVANPYEMYQGYSGKMKVQSLLMHYLLKWYCKHAKALAFVTKQSQQQRYEINKDRKINTYYSSIELKKEFFSDKFLKHDFFNDKTMPIKIGHVANVITGNIKGHKEVLQVADSIQKAGRKVELVFAGEGPDVDMYKKEAEDKGIKATFLGFIDKQQLHKMLLDLDFFLFPSKSEGLPKVLIEAMSVSIPCVASNVGGIPELLPNESVFDSYDVEGMTSRIKELITDKQEYIENAQLMYSTALEYESSVLAERRKCFYNKLKELA